MRERTWRLDDAVIDIRKLAKQTWPDGKYIGHLYVQYGFSHCGHVIKTTCDCITGVVRQEHLDDNMGVEYDN